jgi:O-antigen/teichoic acid export membrane protein
MSAITFCGIFSVGFVFGYLLYYAVRHTKEFSIELLASAIGAIGGGVVVGLLGKTDDWIGPYGLGIGAGFLFYLILCLILIFSKKFDAVNQNKVTLLGKTLLGSPRQE